MDVTVSFCYTAVLSRQGSGDRSPPSTAHSRSPSMGFRQSKRHRATSPPARAAPSRGALQEAEMSPSHAARAQARVAKFRPGWHAPLIPATPNDSARVSQGPHGAPHARYHPSTGQPPTPHRENLPPPAPQPSSVPLSLPLSHLSRGGGSPDGRPGAAGAARGRPERPPQERGAPAPPPRRRHAAAAAARGGGTGTAPASRHHVGGGERPPVPRCTPGVVVPCPQGVMALGQP